MRNIAAFAQEAHPLKVSEFDLVWLLVRGERRGCRGLPGLLAAMAGAAVNNYRSRAKPAPSRTRAARLFELPNRHARSAATSVWRPFGDSELRDNSCSVSCLAVKVP